MKALISTLGRLFSATRLQLIVTGLLLLVGLSAAGVLLFNYFALTDSINTNFQPSSERLPALAGLRNTVVQLHAESVTVLNQDVPDFRQLDILRASLDGRLNIIRAYAATGEDYKKAFDATSILIQIFDANMEAFRSNPNTQIAALQFDLVRSFEVAELELDAVYQRQEKDFITATANTLAQISNIELGLALVGVTIILLGVTLVLTIRRASRREALLASGRLQIAAEIGQAAASVLSLEQLFDTTLNLVVQRFGYYYACVFLTDENGEYAVLRAATGESGRNLIANGHKVLVGSNSTIGQVTFNGRSLIFSESRRQTEYFKNELIAATRSEMAVPLRQGNQIIGALDIQSLEADPFVEADSTILQTLADQIAVAIGNAAEFTREQVRARQMSSLSQASIQLTGPQISLSALLEIVVQEVRPLLSADDVGLWLPVGPDHLELQASAAQAELGRRLRRGEGITGEVFDTGKPSRIDDYPRWEGRSRQLASSGIQSALSVPLLWQAESIGVMTLSRNTVNRPFTKDDEQIAQLYAAQVASAVENNRLLKETQDRVNELFTLNQIGQAIAAQTDLGTLFDTLRREITRALNTQAFYVAFYESATDLIELPYMYDKGDVQVIPAYKLGTGFTSHIIRTGQPLKVDRLEDALALNPLQSGAPAQSYLGVPILQRGRAMGVMAVQDVDKPYAYSDADLRLLSTIAVQVSLSIQNLQLIAETRNRAEELASLNRITTVANSIQDVQGVLENAAREIVTIFKARNSGIALIDPGGQHATVVADANRDPDEPSARGIVIPMEGNLSAQRVIETRRALVIADPQHDPLTAPLHELMRERRTTGLMIVPLLTRDRVIGTVGVDTDEPNRVFTTHEQGLAETIVAQISTAIDNNQLLEETRRRADQLAAAAEVSRAAISFLDPDELLIHAADLIRDRFNLYYAAVFMLDEDGQWAKLRYATGEAGQKLLAMGHRLGVGSQSMVGTAIATQKARIALDVGQEAVRFSNPYLPDTHSELALPLVVGGRAIGALDVQSTRLSAFNEDDIVILQTLADQLAVALENGRLFARQKRTAELEQLVSTVTARIHQTPGLQNIVENAATELGRSLGARKVVVRLNPLTASVPRPAKPAGEKRNGNGEHQII